MKSELINIVYVSFSSRELSQDELEDLLREIRAKNQRKGVTGLLLYSEGSFIQVIEGQQHIINELFEIISRDPRHDTIVKLLEEPIQSRAFPDWYMGFKLITKDQKSQIPGFSNFMNSDNPEKKLKSSTKQVMDLLNSFKKYV